MSDKPAEHFRMETNFDGLIQLLAKHLYPEPDVFIRELVQNGQDAIQRRLKDESEIAGRIDISINRRNKSIFVKDNGIGMDRDDIRQFLAVIGASGTWKTIQQWKAEGFKEAQNLIGQFGIGFLSGFLVAERIVVRTRKVGASSAYRWENRGSLDCQMKEDDFAAVGTEIEVFIGQQHEYFLNDQRLAEVVRKYCGFIPVPIYLNGRGPVNEVEAPFYRNFWQSVAERSAHYEAFVQRRYPDLPLAIIPVEIDGDYSARGVLYISDRSLPDINTQGAVEVLIRRMMIRHEDVNLLPKWAKFVHGVIDSPDLEPTAARDNYQLDHPSVAYLSRTLGEVIVQRMLSISRDEPALFKQINRCHHYHLKGMACIHDEFFRQVSGLLLFETNKGQMSLDNYLTKNPRRQDHLNRIPVYFFSRGGAATQFNRIADAKAWVVIDASDIFDVEFLTKFAKHHENTVVLLNLNETDDPEVFARLAPEEEETFRLLQQDTQGHLGELGHQKLKVRMRKFIPADLPAVIIVHRRTEQEERLRSLRSRLVLASAATEILEDVQDEPDNLPLYLNLNADNRLIRKLAASSRNSPISRAIMTGLYNCSLMHAQNLLNQHNTRVMHGQFLMILESLMDSQESLARINQELETERQQLIEYRKHEVSQQAQRPAHIRLFVITPFGKDYEALECAIREIFETHPYYFEVQLARDYTFESALLDNIREHIERAHGFIAEISDLNPNVMFELGAVMLHEDGRPVLALRSRDSRHAVPADIREKLRIEYASNKQTVAELVAEIRAAIERDGQVIHDSIHDLLAKRGKRFLSRKLLESVAVRLDKQDIANLRKDFSTVEDFLAADLRSLAGKTQIAPHLLQALRGELE